MANKKQKARSKAPRKTAKGALSPAKARAQRGSPRKTAKAQARKKTAKGRAKAPRRPFVVAKRPPTEIVTAPSLVQARMMAARAQGLTVGFVPTMGALHAGHAALLDEARRRADVVVCSVFVNPKQFGPGEDYTRYPRPIEADRKLCEQCGVDVLFNPAVDDIYPASFETQIKGGRLTSELEGAARPGHFDGVLTIVAVLFGIVQPHFAVFGEKDYQQLTLIRRMVRDLRTPLEVVAMPVIRDVDGVALSSRNAYLAPGDRLAATCLYRALMAAQDEAQRGVVEAERFVRAARAVLDATPGVDVDYVEVRDPKTLEPVSTLTHDARLLLAARLGGVRLIDNGPLFTGVRYQA